MIHHAPGQTAGLRFTKYSLMTEVIVGIIVKKDGKPVWSSVLLNIIIEELNLQRKFQTVPNAMNRWNENWDVIIIMIPDRLLD